MKKMISFFPGKVHTCIILKYDGRVRKVENITAIEMVDIESGKTLPVIFFQ